MKMIQVCMSQVATIQFIVDSGACMLMIAMPQAGHSTDIRACSADNNRDFHEMRIT